MIATPPCRLYLVTPPRLPPEFPERFAAALEAGDVGCVQLRLKDADDAVVMAAAERLMPIAAARDIAFVLNDRPDLAARLGCDGVHVGQEDMPYAEARRLIGPERIVGVTCHDSYHVALEAAEQGADYVAFGPFFPSPTKPSAYKPTLDLIRQWAEIVTVPQVAIGGITPENCVPLVAAGADFLAVVSAVWEHPDGPAAAVRAFTRAIAQGLEARETGG